MRQPQEITYLTIQCPPASLITIHQMSTPCPSQIAPAFISNPAIHVKRHTKIPPIMNPPCDPCDLCVSFREIINKTIAEREIKQRNKAITNKRERKALMLTPLRVPKIKCASSDAYYANAPCRRTPNARSSTNPSFLRRTRRRHLGGGG